MKDQEAIDKQANLLACLGDPTVPRRKTVHPEGGRLMTKQSMRDATDANRIMEKWITVGEFPRGPAGSPMYGDFSSGLSYQEALDRVMAARIEFQALPSRVRTACENDPARFLELCSDPANLERLRDLGLAEAQVPETISKVEIVNPVPVNPVPVEGVKTPQNS